MELTDPSALMKLMSDSARMRKPYTRKEAVRKHDRPVARGRRTCQCGECPACLDNAKWERIFREKFEDPDYYTNPTLRSGSSLGWLNRP